MCPDNGMVDRGGVQSATLSATIESATIEQIHCLLQLNLRDLLQNSYAVGNANLASSGVCHMVVCYRDGIMYQPRQVSTTECRNLDSQKTDHILLGWGD